jgi:hypothetical protein
MWVKINADFAELTLQGTGSAENPLVGSFKG